MTREESLNLAKYKETPYYFQRLINKIYDEFNLELEELENRSCINCKHYKIYPPTKEMFCNNENTKIGFRQCDTEKDFCCNKWENKP